MPLPRNEADFKRKRRREEKLTNSPAMKRRVSIKTEINSRARIEG
jgi:hypothetical protein